MSDNAIDFLRTMLNNQLSPSEIIERSNNLNLCPSILGITERSVMGTIINRTGGLVCANGVIRIFGGDNKERASLNEINRLSQQIPQTLPGVLLIGDDIFGGLFGLNTDRFPGLSQGNILYMPPDSVFWEPMENFGYTQFVEWAITMNTGDFFAPIIEKLPNDTRKLHPSFAKTIYFTPSLMTKIDDETKRMCSIIDADRMVAIRVGLLLSIDETGK